MRIVVVGGTGNIGTALLRAAAPRGAVTSIDTVSRRGAGRLEAPGALPVRHHRLDVASPEGSADDRALSELADGADAVIHLAWSWERGSLAASRANAAMTASVMRASRRAAQLVLASCASAYAPSYGLTPRTEAWPTTGVADSSYSADKVGLERLADRFVEEHPNVVLTRVRPAVTLQESAGASFARRQLGAVLPRLGWGTGFPALLWPQGLTLQVAHADDVAAAVLASVERRSPGAFNVASPEVLTADQIGAAIGARQVIAVPRTSAEAAHRVARVLHLAGGDPGAIEALDAQPVLDTTRARDLLGVVPAWSALDVLTTAARGIADRREGWTPALSRAAEPAQRAD